MIPGVVAAGGAAPAITTDDFSTNTIASYTEFADTTGAWAITGGFLAPTSGAVSQSILTRNGVSLANAEVSCVITQADNAGLALRLVDANNYYIANVYDISSAGTSNTVRLFKRVGGAFIQIGSNVAISFARNTSHTFYFSVVGNLLTVKFDGVTKISQTDSTYGAAGKLGPRGSVSSSNKFDSFSWGAL